MVDAFKTSPRATDVALTSPHPRKHNLVEDRDEFCSSSKYFISSSSSSSSSVDFGIDLYDLNDVSWGSEQNVQRSSSFTQSSHHQLHEENRGVLPRRHSLTSIGEKTANSVKKKANKLGEKAAAAAADKKEHKSAWGKVKNMIYTRRDSLKKRNVTKSASMDISSSTVFNFPPPQQQQQQQQQQQPTTPSLLSPPILESDDVSSPTASTGAIPKVSTSSAPPLLAAPANAAVSPARRRVSEGVQSRPPPVSRPQLTLTMTSGAEMNLRSPPIVLSSAGGTATTSTTSLSAERGAAMLSWPSSPPSAVRKKSDSAMPELPRKLEVRSFWLRPNK